MANARRAASVIWRTVVCAAIVPACHQEAAKPQAPEPATAVEEDEPRSEDELPSCSDFPEPEHPQRDVDVPPGDTSDGLVRMLITSEPAGAAVEIDGEVAGTTPLRLEQPLGGPYWMVVVELAGYERATLMLDLSEDRDLAVNAVLIAEDSRPRCVDDKPHADFGFIVS